jgi:hypothetical protein
MILAVMAAILGLAVMAVILGPAVMVVMGEMKLAVMGKLRPIATLEMIAMMMTVATIAMSLVVTSAVMAAQRATVRVPGAQLRRTTFLVTEFGVGFIGEHRGVRRRIAFMMMGVGVISRKVRYLTILMT